MSLVVFQLFIATTSLGASSTSTNKPAASGVGVGRPPSSLHAFQIQNVTQCTAGIEYCTSIGFNTCPASVGTDIYCPGYAGCGNWLGKPTCCKDDFYGFRHPGQPTNTSCDPFRGYLEEFRMPGSNTTNTNGFYPQGTLCNLGSVNGIANWFFVLGSAGFITGNPNITTTAEGSTCCPSTFDAISDWTVMPNSALCVPPVFPDGTTSDPSATSTGSSSASATSTNQAGAITISFGLGRLGGFCSAILCVCLGMLSLL